MKRFFSMLLTLALLSTATVPAFAAADKRLEEVTLAVKNTLAIDETYDSFYGELEETTYQTFWSLNWEGEGKTLTISAGEDGTIYRYHYSRTGNSEITPYYNEIASSSAGSYLGSATAFPEYTAEEARGKAQSFLDKVVTGNTSAVLEDTSGNYSLGSDRYYFYGLLSYYDLESPIGFSISVDSNTGEILSYSRDDRHTIYIDLPGAPTGLTGEASAAATSLLNDTMTMRLEYVLSDDEKTAVLRYLPEPTDQYYVDATTGQIVNLKELYEKMFEGNMGGSSDNSTSESAPDSGLTDAEQEGVDLLKEVKDKEALDKAIRAYGELSLSGYTLNSCSYRVDRETMEVTAYLHYAKKSGDDSVSRNITVDAKTGELISGYGRTWADEDFTPKLSVDAAKGKADSFLKKLWGEEFVLSEVYTTAEAEKDGYSCVHTFTYAQKMNGYFFPANTITVSVDAEDGSIVSFYKDFEQQPTFEQPENLISMEEAHKAWCDTFDTVTGYTKVPVALADYGSRYETLIDMGYPYVYTLKLGYTLEQSGDFHGIDAKTGEAVAYPGAAEEERIVYDDLSGHWGETIAQELARYEIGFLGGALQPSKTLTQPDLLALLLSTKGILIDLAAEDAIEQVYQYAYERGLLMPEQRQESREITRAELTKYLLDSEGYGEVASIPGIFRCDFADEATIPDAYYGYVAIAKGIGMVKGDTKGNFRATDHATRMEALSMLYAFLNR